jgi:hypothetical protein
MTLDELTSLEHGDHVLYVSPSDGHLLPGRYVRSGSGGEGRDDVLILELANLDSSTSPQFPASHECCIRIPHVAAILSCGHQARVPAASALPARAVCPLSSGIAREVVRYQEWSDPEPETRRGYCGPDGWRAVSDSPGLASASGAAS